MKIQKIMELEQEATRLTGIKTIEDYEYQKVHYKNITIRNGKPNKKQTRSKIFKLKGKIL